MPQLSRPLGLLCLGLLFAAVMLIAVPPATVWQRELMDAGHGPVFAAMAAVILLMQSPSGARRARAGWQYGLGFVLTVVIGALSEWLQRYLPNRSVSLGDLWHDTLGAVLGLGLVALIEHRRTGEPGSPRTAWLWAFVWASVVALAWSPLHCARAYATRLAAFPTLAPLGQFADDYFAAVHDATRSYVPLPAPWRRAGERDAALRLDFAATARPALELQEFERDWRGREMLSLDLTNPGDAPATFVLRILDAHHDWSHEDRLNLPVVIPPRTRTTVRVAVAAVEQAPAGRPMDLAAVTNVMLFAPQPSGNRSFYVSRVWLE